MSCLKLLHILTEIFCGESSIYSSELCGAIVLLWLELQLLDKPHDCTPRVNVDLIMMHCQFFVTTFYCLNLPGIFVSLLKRDLDLWELYYNINFVMFTYEVSGEVSDSYHFFWSIYNFFRVYIHTSMYICTYIYSHTFIYIIYEWVEFL